MLVVLVASGLGLLALPGLAQRAGRRLHPAEWSRLCVVGIAGGAAIVEVAALLHAAPTLARAARIPVLAELCERTLGPLAPGGAAVGWIAVAVALMLAAAGGVGWARSRRSTRRLRVEGRLGRRSRWGEHQLVVLPAAQPVAVSMPALAGPRQGQIVISDGLLKTLSPAELGAVLDHEAAHLRHRHHRYLTVAAAIDHAFAWLPPARRSTATLRLALERWADEDATTDGNRYLLRAALLAVTASLAAEPQVAAFSTADTIGERLKALDADPPRPPLPLHVLLYWPGTLLGAMAVITLSSWASGTTAVLAMAGTCT